MIFKNSNLSTRSLCMAMSLFVLLCSGILAGCGGSDTDDGSATEDAAAAPSTPAEGLIAANTSGSAGENSNGLSGIVTFAGPRPERAVLQTESDAKCAAMHTDAPLLSDKTIVNEDGGVQNVFVYIKNAPEGDYPIPTEQVVLDQIACRYVPHIIGIRVGQEIAVKNSDPTLHNVRASARINRPWNNALPEGAPPRIKKFKKMEMLIRLKCDIHPWMTGVIFAMDHPFFAVTDESGSYSINGLPPGDYTLVAWHESFGEQESAITVSEGPATTADFTFTAQ